jgi:hypothetical protein
VSESPSEEKRLLPDSRFRKVPIEEITTPVNGRIAYVNYWWAVTDDGDVLFYIGPKGRCNTPQCNLNKTVVEHCIGNMEMQGVSACHIAVAYLEPRE